MSTAQVNILITNDDGIHSPGIYSLWKSLNFPSKLSIVAPATEQSSTGLAITLREPLRLQKVVWDEKEKTDAWSVNGTPADCVKLALNVALKEKPDLIVSGINRGNNAGRNLFYSGTIAAVIEGVFHNIPGIAFSCHDYVNPNFNRFEKYVTPIVEYVLKFPLPKGTFLNVNFPSTQFPVKGFKMARQGLSYWAEDPIERLHPAEGHSYYWLGSKMREFDEHVESDIHLLTKGYITAVPISVTELTDKEHFEEKKTIFEGYFPEISL